MNARYNCIVDTLADDLSGEQVCVSATDGAFHRATFTVPTADAPAIGAKVIVTASWYRP